MPEQDIASTIKSEPAFLELVGHLKKVYDGDPNRPKIHSRKLKADVKNHIKELYDWNRRVVENWAEREESTLDDIISSFTDLKLEDFKLQPRYQKWNYILDGDIAKDNYLSAISARVKRASSFVDKIVSYVFARRNIKDDVAARLFVKAPGVPSVDFTDIDSMKDIGAVYSLLNSDDFRQYTTNKLRGNIKNAFGKDGRYNTSTLDSYMQKLSDVMRFQEKWAPEKAERLRTLVELYRDRGRRESAVYHVLSQYDDPQGKIEDDKNLQGDIIQKLLEQGAHGLRAGDTNRDKLFHGIKYKGIDDLDWGLFIDKMLEEDEDAFRADHLNLPLDDKGDLRLGMDEEIFMERYSRLDIQEREAVFDKAFDLLRDAYVMNFRAENIGTIYDVLTAMLEDRGIGDKFQSYSDYTMAISHPDMVSSLQASSLAQTFVHFNSRRNLETELTKVSSGRDASRILDAISRNEEARKIDISGLDKVMLFEKDKKRYMVSKKDDLILLVTNKMPYDEDVRPYLEQLSERTSPDSISAEGSTLSMVEEDAVRAFEKTTSKNNPSIDGILKELYDKRPASLFFYQDALSITQAYLDDAKSKIRRWTSVDDAEKKVKSIKDDQRLDVEELKDSADLRASEAYYNFNPEQNNHYVIARKDDVTISLWANAKDYSKEPFIADSMRTVADLFTDDKFLEKKDCFIRGGDVKYLKRDIFPEDDAYRYIMDISDVPGGFTVEHGAPTDLLAELGFDVTPKGRIRKRDYIQKPKDNGYMSVHLRYGKPPVSIELQVRDDEMHYLAEKDEASHDLYKQLEVSQKLESIICKHLPVEEKTSKEIMEFWKLMQTSAKEVYSEELERSLEGLSAKLNSQPAEDIGSHAEEFIGLYESLIHLNALDRHSLSSMRDRGKSMIQELARSPNTALEKLASVSRVGFFDFLVQRYDEASSMKEDEVKSDKAALRYELLKQSYDGLARQIIQENEKAAIRPSSDKKRLLAAMYRAYENFDTWFGKEAGVFLSGTGKVRYRYGQLADDFSESEGMMIPRSADEQREFIRYFKKTGDEVIRRKYTGMLANHGFDPFSAHVIVENMIEIANHYRQTA